MNSQLYPIHNIRSCIATLVLLLIEHLTKRVDHTEMGEPNIVNTVIDTTWRDKGAKINRPVKPIVVMG